MSPTPVEVDQELTDFTPITLADHAQALAQTSAVIADAHRALSQLTAPGDGALAAEISERLAEFERRAREAGLDLSAVPTAVDSQGRVVDAHTANAPTDEEIAEAQRAVDRARAALADGTGTQQDVDDAVAHLNDLLARRKAADEARDKGTEANADIVNDPASLDPKAHMPAPAAPAGAPTGSPAGAPAGSSPMGANPTTPDKPKTPITKDKLDQMLGRHPGSPSPGLISPGTIPTTTSMATPATPPKGRTVLGLPTKENISGKIGAASPFPIPSAPAKPAAGNPAMGAGGAMGGMPMMPPMGAGANAAGKGKEKEKEIDPDSPLNRTASVEQAADGGVLSPEWRR